MGGIHVGMNIQRKHIYLTGSDCSHMFVLTQQSAHIPPMSGHLRADKQPLVILVFCRELNYNQLSGSLPSSIGSIKQLEYLLVGARASVLRHVCMNTQVEHIHAPQLCLGHLHHADNSHLLFRCLAGVSTTTNLAALSHPRSR